MATHRDLALQWAEEAGDLGAALSGMTHALLAIEERLDVLAYLHSGQPWPRTDLDADASTRKDPT